MARALAGEGVRLGLGSRSGSDLGLTDVDARPCDVRGFTRALDHEVRERGVRCTNVCPGGVASAGAVSGGPSRA